MVTKTSSKKLSPQSEAKAANDNAERPRPDRAEAEKFIAALAGRADAMVTFQTFLDDGKGKGAWTRTASLGEVWESLVTLNDEGHGIFVMVNEGDGRGRKQENVVAARALFIDDDGKGETPIAFVEGKPPFDKLPPSITVQSKAGQHNYWLLVPGQPLDEFTPMQKALAEHFGTDTAVKDLPRVMRVPGFLHQKVRQDPFLVRVVQTSDARYTMKQVRDAYGIELEQKVQRVAPKPLVEGAALTVNRETRLSRARAYAKAIPPAVEGQQGEPHTFTVCCAVARGFALNEDEAFEVLAEWNTTCDPPWSEVELRQKIRNALNHGEEPIGGRLDTKDAKAAERKRNIILLCIEELNAKFGLLREADGAERVYSVNEKREVVLQGRETIMRQVLHDAVKKEFDQIPSEDLLTHAIKLWKRECPKMIGEPEPFCFAGDDRLCFKRFDWVPTQGEHRAWDEFLSRLSDASTFKAFFWSCFERANASRQYLWLSGAGQDGKSAVLRVLHSVFGNSSAAISNIAMKGDGRFFFSGVYGRRVILYGDCKNARVGMSEIVRNLTAGDPVQVEFKGQTPFTVELRAKLFIASNLKPEISSLAADQSRLIWIEVAESKNKDDPGWSARLEKELPAFLYSCREAYKAHCPNGGDIKPSDRTIELGHVAAELFEQRYNDLFETHFEKDPESKVPAARVAEVLKQAGLTSNEELGNFRQWMQRVHGIEYKKTNEGRFYIGIRLRVNALVRH